MNATFLLADLPAPSPEPYLTFTLIVVTLFLGGAVLWVLMGLARNPAWSIADAVSEEAGNQPATLPPGVKPIMVASVSRLIAVLGLTVLIAMSIGVGYSVIWTIFTHQQLQLQGVLSYFYGMAALFAPYAVNQLKEAFSAFAQPPAPTPPTNPQHPASVPTPGSSQAPQQPAQPAAAQNPALQPSVQLPTLKLPVQPGSQN